MAIKKQYRLTQDGVNELQAELDRLKAGRKEITERIKSARELGDLSENFEYSSARQEQEKAEARISELEAIVQNVEIIKEPKNSGKVTLGSTVKLDCAGKKSKELKVVGTVEADPLAGKVSDESPIGKALLGKKVGEEVDIVTPAATTTYKIVSIG